MPIEWVFLDVGGVLFSDGSYFDSLYEAIADAVLRLAADRAWRERIRSTGPRFVG